MTTDAYNAVKAAKVKSICKCPTCGTQFQKKSYQHTFCTNKGAVNCKDTFWNASTPSRQHFTSTDDFASFDDNGPDY